MRACICGCTATGLGDRILLGQSTFQMQLPCPDLEQAIADRHAGNVELIAHPTASGAPPVIRLHARSGNTELFEPITVDPLAISMQLRTWRERAVPWLYAGDRLRRVGSLADFGISAPPRPPVPRQRPGPAAHLPAPPAPWSA